MNKTIACTEAGEKGTRLRTLVPGSRMRRSLKDIYVK